MEQHQFSDSVLISIYEIDAHDLKNGKVNGGKKKQKTNA